MSAEPEKKPAEAESGLDARLEKVVPVEHAVGFLLAGDGTQPGRVFPLTRNTNIVGRSETADVKIPQPAISAEHARIINGSLGFEIEDLNSINGTYVNGVRITRSKLQRGDRLTLGNVEFTFLLEKTQDATMALLPPRAAPSPRRTTLTGARPVGPSPYREVHDDEGGVSLGDVIRGGVGAYRTLRPYLPMSGGFAVAGLALGIAAAAAIPAPSTALCEAKIHPVRKLNPVDGESRPAQEGDTVQYFVDAERSFVHGALVRSTLEQLEGKAPDEGRVGEIQGRLRLEPAGERLYRAVYAEPMFGAKDVPADKLLEAHVNNYFTTDIDKGLRALDNEAKFLSEKLAAASADLTRINGELAEFKRANADDLPETSEQAHSSRYYLETRRSELTAQIARLSGELSVDEAQLKEENPLAASKFQASQVYRGSLAELKRKLNEAYSRGLGDAHPEILQLKNEMGRLEKVIADEMAKDTSAADRSADPAIAALRAKVGVARASLNAARIELAEVDRNLGRVKRAVTTMPAVAARLDDLQRQYDTTKRLHDQLSEQAHKAKLQLDVERLAAKSRYEILTPAHLQTPSKARTFGQRGAIGIAFGLFLAALVIALREGKKAIARTLASNPHRA